MDLLADVEESAWLAGPHDRVEEDVDPGALRRLPAL